MEEWQEERYKKFSLPHVMEGIQKPLERRRSGQVDQN